MAGDAIRTYMVLVQSAGLIMGGIVEDGGA